MSSVFIGHVSFPYTKTLCTHVLETFPFIFREAPLTVKTGANDRNFAQAHLALDALSAPPPAANSNYNIYANEIIEDTLIHTGTDADRTAKLLGTL